MLLLFRGLELRTKRFELRLHVGGARVVRLLQRMKLLSLGLRIGKELLVLVLRSLTKLLELALLLVGQIQFRGYRMAHRVAVATAKALRLPGPL